MSQPYVLRETRDYAVLFKPAHFHSVPLKHGGSEQTLLGWYGILCPEALSVRGPNIWEGGMVHRLDYETKGLVLVAKTQDFMSHIQDQQRRGLFTKEYSALTMGKSQRLARGLLIESAFMPFGPGRKKVKAIVEPYPRNKEICLDQGRYYCTELLESHEEAGKLCIKVRLVRGFRHQVRCHLAWVGAPIINDALYGGITDGGELCLTATGLEFLDCNAKQVKLSLELR